MVQILNEQLNVTFTELPSDIFSLIMVSYLISCAKAFPLVQCKVYLWVTTASTKETYHKPTIT